LSLDLAVSTYGIRLPVEEMLAELAELGFRRIEFAAVGGSNPVMEDWPPEKLMPLLERHGLSLAAIWPKPVGAHDYHADKNAEALSSIEIASRFDVPIVFSPLLPREDYDYAKLAEILDGLPCPVVLENHYNWPMMVPEDYRRLQGLLADASRVTMCLDCGHLHSAGMNAADVVRDPPMPITHAHLKDRRGTETTLFGEGETDMKGFVDALRETGYSGPVTVEMERGQDVAPADKLADIAQALAFCRRELDLHP
jgi:sugar phosphate isomerase/epimerase